MNNLLNVNKKWNRLMELIGTPVTVFIFLSWCNYTVGITPVSMSIFFIIGVLFGSPNFVLAICESVLGVPFLMIFRTWFLIPINLPFLAEPFSWWNQQTACAGIVTIVFIMFMVKLVVTISGKMVEK